MDYDLIRKLYYFGILILVVYALPAVGLIRTYIYPVLEYQLIPEVPIITIIALLTGVAAFIAYKYRTIG